MGALIQPGTILLTLSELYSPGLRAPGCKLGQSCARIKHDAAAEGERRCAEIIAVVVVMGSWKTTKVL